MNQHLDKQIQLRVIFYDRHTGRASIRTIPRRVRSPDDGPDDREDTMPDGRVLLLDA
ncbi:MAG TPA: hypothetical protein VFQ53_30690 [Kofleriaceae bacterium]|nr:hypothetical protein [Kofleriaceae bacterium]